MSKIIFFPFMIFILLFFGCYVTDNEYHPELEDWLSVINSDSTGFDKILQISYNNANYLHRIKVHNFVVTKDKSYFIVNGGLNGISRIDIDGKNPQILSDTLWVRQTELAISQDNSMIAFVSRGNIYRANIDGSNLVCLTQEKNDYDDYPAFMNGDTEIVYSKIVSLGDSTQYHSICKMDIDGNNQKELLANLAKEEQLYTYPTGLQNSDIILFNQFGENPGICSFNISSEEISYIYNGEILNKRLSISANESELIAITDNEILVIDSSGSVLIDIHEVANKWFDEAVISPDGEFIALSNYSGLHKYSIADETLTFMEYGVLPFCFNDQIYFIWDMD